MYGTNAPQGLRPLRFLSGAPFNDAVNPYAIASGYAANIFQGDLVKFGTNGTLNVAAAGDAVIGVFWGCLYTLPSGIAPVTPSPYWPTGTVTANALTATAYVVDHPDIVYTIQETNGSGVAGTPLTQTAVGQNFNIYAGVAGSTVTGLSGMSLNNASTPTTATNNLKIIGFDPNIANLGSGGPTSPPAPITAGTAFQNWLVIINNHLYKGGTGTTGHS